MTSTSMKWMKPTLCAAAAVAIAATAGVAGAQPAPVAPAEPAQPEPAPEPAPPPPEPAPPPRRIEPAPVLAPRAADAVRPDALSIAIGLGFVLPAELDTPNITSVRLRLASGLTFEPQVVFASSSRDVDTGSSVTDEVSEVGIGTLVRFPVVKRGRVDLEVLGAFNINSLKQKPDLPDTDRTLTTTSLNYGLAVSSWITRHWQVSLTGQNSLVSVIKNRQEMGPGITTVTTDTTFGLVFDPIVTLMVHLYH